MRTLSEPGAGRSCRNHRAVYGRWVGISASHPGPLRCPVRRCVFGPVSVHRYRYRVLVSAPNKRDATYRVFFAYAPAALHSSLRDSEHCLRNHGGDETRSGTTTEIPGTKPLPLLPCKENIKIYNSWRVCRLQSARSQWSGTGRCHKSNSRAFRLQDFEPSTFARFSLH
ncbi:hypothetical protein BT67DRAFT_375 [Trichocladium antarcticum]|uniref:Uncharacterized protein n=1 Tax=Trichocladium antarcticum TaxID=1450529 RepID=A0AAN6URZ8_9PEZI|nr:hypothetical protein BT67DRAFT_375 [Trichocladium antarcticum]